MFMKVYDWVGKVEIQISKYALGLMTALIFLSAVLRTVGLPLSFAVDGATFLFAWCVFLAADVAMRKDKLVCVDILVVRLPKKAQFFIRLINYLIIAAFLTVLVIYGAKLTYETRYRMFQGIYWLSYSWVTLAVPLGALMMLITSILKIKEQIKKGIAGFESNYASDQGEFL